MFLEVLNIAGAWWSWGEPQLLELAGGLAVRAPINQLN